MYIDPAATVAEDARIGEGTRVWGLAQVREQARIGSQCIVGRGAYIDAGVVLGHRCKVQNNALLYAPAQLEDGVFVGPAAILTNDRRPRAVNLDGELKAAADWDADGIIVRTGAAIGAGATVVAGVTVGRWAMVAAGAVVTVDVADHRLVVGVPARPIGWVCRCGTRLESTGSAQEWRCPVDRHTYRPVADGLQRWEVTRDVASGSDRSGNDGSPPRPHPPQP